MNSCFMSRSHRPTDWSHDTWKYNKRWCYCLLFIFCLIMARNLFHTYYQNISKKKSWTALSLKMGPIGCFETSVTNNQSTLLTIQKEWRSQGSFWRNRNGLNIFFTKQNISALITTQHQSNHNYLPLENATCFGLNNIQSS